MLIRLLLAPWIFRPSYGSVIDWRKGFIFVTSATHIHFMHDNAALSRVSLETL